MPTPHVRWIPYLFVAASVGLSACNQGQAGSEASLSTGATGATGSPVGESTHDPEPAETDFSSGPASSGQSSGGSESEGSPVATTDDPDMPFDPDQVTSCADLGLEGLCLDVYDEVELEATRINCPDREICRIVVHPGTYNMDASLYTLNHWYRHYIGVLDEQGRRPTITSLVGSVFANKGNPEVQQNTILQNLVLAGPSPGVDFDGATGEPYFHMGGLSWLDGVEIDTDNRQILFNTGPNPGGGSFWCTRCEIIHRQTASNPNEMMAITAIDSAWFSDCTLHSENWSSYTITLTPRSVGIDGVVDGDGNAIGCGDHSIECIDGPNAELLRAPTLEWFESLVLAQPH